MKNKITTLLFTGLIALPSFAATTTTKRTYTEVEKRKPHIDYVSDSGIRKSLDHLIDSRAELDDDVSISVENSVVTLRGVVDNNLEAKQAVDLAYSVKGVEHVVDKLRSEEAGMKTYNNTSYKQTTETSTYTRRKM